MNDVHSAIADVDPAHFGYARFGARLPGATPETWMNRPGISMTSGKPSRLSRVVYVGEDGVKVWGVHYPNCPALGPASEGVAFLREQLHCTPSVRWLAFVQDGNRGIAPADLWLNVPGGSVVAYTTIERGRISARPDLMDAILARLRQAHEGGEPMSASEASSIVKRWLENVALNAAQRLDGKGLANLEKLRARLAAEDKRRVLQAAESLYLRHMDAIDAELLARHVERFWETSHV